jgi:tail collar domain
MPDSPIGSIIAYAGVITRAWEDQNGWLHCDGRLLDATQPDNVALFKAIGFAWGGDGDSKFNVPDLQGFFLRGVDPERPPPTADTRVPFPVDKETNFRFPIRFGGNEGNKVGSAQLFATARPREANKFITSPSGGHTHRMNFETTATRDVNSQSNTVAFPLRGGEMPQTESGGNHKHEIADGGDVETRPINAYVYWIIRHKLPPAP